MYDKYLNINKKFKSSVNLNYDLYNEEKIEQYIPTTDLCDVIKSYIKTILDNGQRATFLAGPYGKGKSYLMLMISYLISLRKNRKLFISVIEKFKKIDVELAYLIVKMDNRNISLLPVIVSNDSDDINQNFMLALNNSLKDNGLIGIVPKCAFTECLSLLDKWSSKDNEGEYIFKECLKKQKINLKDLKNGLKNFNKDSYKEFEELFKCVSMGYTFNPLVTNDIGVMYSDVVHNIKQYGFSGIFVIFDEFGVFLENQNADFILKLNRIQSFAEKCNASTTDEQLHICCITHKDVSLYNNKKDKDLLVEFEKIAGRFKQNRFDRSLDENYQIICSAIQKQEGYDAYVQKSISQNNDFISSLKSTNIFTSENQLNYILHNGFPINPISLYSLIQVSEKVAQNERTLFTFLSDSDRSGFNYFINNNDKGLLNVPHIYDYFEDLIKDNEEYKWIFYKVQSLKKLTLKQIERDIFKVIAIIDIINDKVKFNASINNIALSLLMPEDDIELLIEKLISKNYLRQNINDSSIDFALITDDDLNAMIDSVSINRFANVEVSKLLSSFDLNKYYFSTKYNFQYKMVRYYSSIYLEASKFESLNDFNILLESNSSDGLLINLINDLPITQSIIKSKLVSHNYNNIIVRYSTHGLSKNVVDKLRKLFAVRYIIETEKKISDVSINSLKLLHDDLTEELNKYLKEFHRNSKSFNSVNFNEHNLNNCIYLSLKETYSKTYLFNNEQVNKNIISSVTSKARNNVISAILLNTDSPEQFGTTSAEATIYQSYLDSIENNVENNIIKLICDWIISSNGNKICFGEVVNKLTKKPYGLRLGIIPILLAKSISSLSIESSNNKDTVILYNEAKEIEINASNLSQIVSNPTKYFLCFEELNSTKLKMVKDLLGLFKCDSELSFNENIKCLIKNIKSTISNYPSIILKTSINDNVLSITKEAILFKEVFIKHDINNYEVLFNELPSVLCCSYEEVFMKVKQIIDEYDISFNKFVDRNINHLKECFDVKSPTIKSMYDIWKSNYSYLDNIIFDDIEKNIHNAFKKIQFNDYDSLNMLSFSALNCTVNEWTEKKKNLFFELINKYISKVINYKENSSASNKDFISFGEIKLSSLGKTLYSNIIVSLEEYGSSLSPEEKTNVLKKIIYEILS